MTQNASLASAPQVHITRVFSAPRELVFQAWIDPVHLAQWYAPHGCTVRIPSLDARPGGTFLFCISNPKGECWCKGVYRQVSPPERLVLTLEVADPEGRSRTPSEAGMDPEWPQETLVTLTFEKLEPGQTKMTLEQTVLESLAKRTGAYPSWLQMFDRLEELLPTLAQPGTRSLERF